MEKENVEGKKMKKVIMLTLLSFFCSFTALATSFKCTVISSSGTFSSFIQPRALETIEIDLNNLDALVGEDGVIQFQNRAYISFSSMPPFKLSSRSRGSHDSGGWQIRSKSDWRDFRIEILKNYKGWMAWIIDESSGDLTQEILPAISITSMSCEVI